MAEKVGKKKDYDIIYSYLSEIEHSVASSLTRYVKLGDSSLSFQPGPSTENIDLALMLNYNHFYLLLKTVNRLIPLPMDLEAQKRSFAELYKVEPSEP